MKKLYTLDCFLPANSHIINTFQACYGLGFSKSRILVPKLGFLFNHFLNTSLLFSEDVNFYNLLVSNLVQKSFKFRVNLDAKYDIQLSFHNIRMLKNRRYVRHRQFLPVRGQRSHFNAKTQKSKKKRKDVLFFKFDERRKKTKKINKNVGKKK